MGYECATIDQLESRDPDNSRPVDRFTILPGLPRNRVLFRLYASHTNLGSSALMLRELRRIRTEAGVVDQPQPPEEPDMPKPTRLRRLVRTARTLTVATAIGATAYGLGTYTANRNQPKDTADAQPAPTLEPIEWPRWTGAGSSPFIGGRRLRQGDWITPRAQLEYLDPSGRRLVARVDDVEWWLWVYPEPEPRRVGTVDDIRDSVQRLQQADAASGRGSVQGSPAARP
jgi:hypothetical protein